jgi:type I restriction enzyme S subunit
MKRYSEYTDSGVKWIGEIPSHWKSRFLSQIANEQNLSNKGMINDNLLSLSYGRIIRKSMDSANGLLPASFETYQVINNGNIILRFTDLQNDHKSLRVGLVKEEGIITSAYTCITPKKSVLSEYLYFLLHSADIKKVFYGMGGGLRQNLNYAEFRKLRLMIPPLPEQNEIVAYLDKKVSKIDKYISTAEKKIAALDELKQVTIADAVTHGINPNAPMKNSGIPWIGMVPEHWESRSLSQIASEQNLPNKGMINDNLLSLSYGRIIRKSMDSANGLLPASFETYQVINNGNIILRFTDLQNDHKSLRVGLVKEEGIITSAYTCITPKKSVLSEYLYFLLHSADIKKVFYGMGGGLRQNLNYAEFRKLRLMIPPLPEQNEIVAYLDRKVAQIDKMKAAELTQINKLKEYKQRLISDVVTGKVKVTNE